MNRLLAATAIATVSTGMAFAQADTGIFSDLVLEDGQSYLASDLMGQRIYAAEQEYEIGTPIAAGTQMEWDDIGEIGDIAISADGSLEALIIDVGGFLGIGEREIAVRWDAVRPVVEDDDPDDVFLVVNGNAETFENAPEFQRTVAMETSEAVETDTATVTTTEPATVTTTETETEAVVVEEEEPTAGMRLDGEREMLRMPAFEREGYETVTLDEMTSEDMTGMRIYGPNDEDIGEISELIMSSDGGTVERAVLDVGGFLGLGEHQVAVTLDELQILRGEDGANRAYIDATQEELEAQPEYEG